MATDLASISGLVFDDFMGNGFDAGEEVSGATLTLHRDVNNDGMFQQGSDTQVALTMTGTDGRYEFSRLTADGYFVLQDAQTAGGHTLQRTVSPLITIDSTAVEGRIVQVVDSFDVTSQLVFDDLADGIPVTSTILATEAIGGERDLFVNKTSVNGAVQLSVNDPLLPNLLLFDSIATGNGERRVTWDGPDGDATSVDDTGLGSEDLTSGGDALGMQLQIGADLAGGTAVVRLYSNDNNAGTANRFSTAMLPIPVTGGTVSLPEFLPYSSFTPTSGGGVDFNDVGAIELEVTGAANVNGSAELVGTVGQTVFTQDFANFEQADLSLSKTIDDATPNIGQNVTFTITLNSSGPDTATNVAVRDQLPAGVAFVSSTPSQGTYDGGTGLWSVGTVNSGANPTLQLVGRIESAGARVNFAEVSASDQFDPDSTPDNGQQDNEDDQAIVNFVTESIDLSLVKIAVPTTVVVGSNVTFTLTLSNDGVSQATGVMVRDQLPSGISFFGATPSQGTYSSQTGIWDVGSVGSGSSAILSIVGTVDVAGPKTNTAEVVAADQLDTDSTPDNNVPGEDDQDSATIEAPQIDLSLTKAASPTSVIVGQNVTYTINLSNAGPSQATSVTVLDQLPGGVTFVSATPSQGGYDDQSGIWTVGTVGAGISPTLTIVGRVDVAGSKTNTAQVQSADQPDLDSTPGNNVESEDDQNSVTIEAPQIDLELTKSATPSSVVVGENVTFTVSLANDGPSEATGVSVQDQLPAGVSFVSANATQGMYNSANGLWTVGTISQGMTQTLTIVGRVDTPGSKTNTAQVSAADQPDLDSTPANNVEAEDDQDSVTIQAPQIDLSLAKSVDNMMPNVGENITFTLVLSNVGPDIATGVQVRDLLPGTLTFVSSATAAGTYDSGTGIWNVGSVNANSNASLTITATPTTTDIVTNSAEVIAADQPDPDSTPNNNDPTEDDQSSVLIGAQQIDLSVAKTVDQSRPNVGDTITFEVVVSNAGPSDASGVVVQDLLPLGLTIVSSTPSEGGYDSLTGRWTIGDIASQTSQSLVIQARVDAVDFVTNTAEVIAADQADPDSTPGNGVEDEDDQDSVTVSPLSADLSLTKVVDNDRPNVGETVTFTITVQNNGPDNANNVMVSDLLPPGITFVSSTPSQGDYNAVSGVWTIGTIGSQGQVSLPIVGRIDSTGAKTNAAQVTASDQFDPDSTPANSVESEDDQDSVTVTPPVIDLSLTKSVDNASPNVGDDVTFMITTTNSGPDPATGVSVLDQLPSGLDFVSSMPDVGTYNSNTGIWDIGDLAVNGTASLTLVATSTTAQSVSNTAQVNTADQFDPDSTPGNGVPTEDDQASVEVVGEQIDLSLTKVVDNERPNVGDQIRFTLTLSNSGPSQATGVSVRDLLPAGLTFQSSNASQGSYDTVSGIWNVGSLTNGGVATLSLFAAVDEILSVVNTAEVITADQADIDSTPDNGIAEEDDQDSATVTTLVSDLSLLKTVDDDRPDVGQQVTFTLSLRNDGPDGATGVSVLDQLPAGLLFISATASQGNYSSQSGIWTVGEITNRTTATLDIVGEVLNIGEKINTAEVISADQADPDSTVGNGVDTEDDQDSASILPNIIDLSLEKTATPLRPSVGGALTYTVTIRNEGPDQATGIIVEDTLPSGTSFVSATPSLGQFDPPSGRWTIAALAPSSSATLQLLTTVDAPGEPTNRVQVIAADQFDSDSTPGNDDGIDGNGNDEDDQAAVTVTTASADLAVTKTVSDDRPGVGSNVTYTVVVTNAGPDAAENVVILDEIPSGLTFVSSSPTAGTYNSTTGRWTIASLGEAATETLEIVVRVTSLGEKVNTAELIASSEFDPDSTPGNNNPAEDDQDSASLVPELVDLALTKVVDDSAPNVGDTVRFTLEVTNQGPSTATGVLVTDKLPNGLTVTQILPSQGVYDPVSGIWNIGSVPAGVRPRLDIDVRVTAPTAQTNVAEITAADQPDLDSTPGNGVIDEDDYAQVELTPQMADLALSKSVNNPTPDQNEQLIFTVVLTNDGPNAATNVSVRDILPSGLNFVSATESSGSYDRGSGLWNIANVPAGSAASLQLVATVDSMVPMINTAEVIASDQFDPDSAPDNQVLTEDDISSASVTPRVIDVSVAASVDREEPNPGEVVEMIFTVTNTGPDDATGLQVRVALPDGLTLISSRPQRGTYNVPGMPNLWNVGNLAVGESVNLVITARADSRGTKRVEMQVMAHNQADIDSTPANNIASEDDQTTLLVRVPLFSKRLFLGSD